MSSTGNTDEVSRMNEEGDRAEDTGTVDSRAGSGTGDQEENATRPEATESTQGPTAESAGQGDNVPTSEDNQQPVQVPRPFPAPLPGMVGASPTPSTISPWPAAGASSAGSAATSTELARAQVPGAEDNTLARQMLERGPPPPIIEPDNHAKVALHHGVLTLVRLGNAGRNVEEANFREALQGVWSQDDVENMYMYLVQTRDEAPSPREFNGYEEAMGGNLQHRQDPHLEGAAFLAALTAVHLHLAGHQDMAGQVRQLAAVLFHDENVHVLMLFHRRNGIPPTAREERRYDQAMAGEQPPEEEERSDEEDQQAEVVDQGQI